MWWFSHSHHIQKTILFSHKGEDKVKKVKEKIESFLDAIIKGKEQELRIKGLIK